MGHCLGPCASRTHRRSRDSKRNLDWRLGGNLVLTRTASAESNLAAQVRRFDFLDERVVGNDVGDQRFRLDGRDRRLFDSFLGDLVDHGLVDDHLIDDRALDDRLGNQVLNRRPFDDRNLDNVLDRGRAHNLRLHHAAPTEATTAPGPRLLHHGRDLLDRRLIDRGNFFGDEVDNGLIDKLVEHRLVDAGIVDHFVNSRDIKRTLNGCLLDGGVARFSEREPLRDHRFVRTPPSAQTLS